MRDRYQGGSLAGFIIIGVLLTLVLVGGLYGLNRYNAERANTEVAQEDEAEQKASNAEDERPADDETDTAGREQDDEGTSEGGRLNTEPDENESQQESGSQTAELPETGPADSILMLIVVGLVTFAGVHFLQSRTR